MLPENIVNQQETRYETVAANVLSALDSEVRDGMERLAGFPMIDREVASVVLGSDVGRRVCGSAIDLGLYELREQRLGDACPPSGVPRSSKGDERPRTVTRGHCEGAAALSPPPGVGRRIRAGSSARTRGRTCRGWSSMQSTRLLLEPGCRRLRHGCGSLMRGLSRFIQFCWSQRWSSSSGMGDTQQPS